MPGRVGGVALVEGTFSQVPIVAQPDRLRRCGVPVQATRVVGAETHPGAPRGVGPLPHEVASGSAAHGVAVPGAGCVPQAHAVVVFRGDHHVGSPGRHQFGDGRVGVESLGPPGVEEVVVVAAAVHLGVVPLRGTTLQPDGVVVPLGVGVVPEPLGRRDLAEFRDGLPPRGHRVRPPVDEESELGAPEPLRGGARERFPAFGVAFESCLQVSDHRILLC